MWILQSSQGEIEPLTFRVSPGSVKTVGRGSIADLILDAADNARARAIVKTLRETTRLLGANTADKTRTLTDIDDEHAPIIDAIIAGDPDGAEAAMRVHLVNTGKLLVAQAVLSDDSGLSVDEIWSAVIS